MENTCPRAEKIYLFADNSLTTFESLTEWVINHLGCQFRYNPGECSFSSTREDHSVSTDGVCVQSHHHTPRVVYAASRDSELNTSCTFDIESQIRCFHNGLRFIFVIDGSISLLTPNAHGKCFMNDLLYAVRILLEQLVIGPSLVLPGSGFCLNKISPVVTIIVVVPNSQCHTVLSDWNVCCNEFPSKITLLTSSMAKIERFLASQKERMLDPLLADHIAADCQGSFLMDLFKHGILSSSFSSRDTEQSSLILFTDGAFSVNNQELLDRALTHLRAERIRCSFVLIRDPVSFSDCVPSTGHALNCTVGLGSCLAQHDLCTFIAEATGGFLLTASSDFESLKTTPCNKTQWNVIKEALYTFPVISEDHVHGDYGNLGWVPSGVLQTASKVIDAPLSAILAARLRDGYKLRSVKPIINLTDPFNSFNFRQSDSNGSFRPLQLELDVPWKVGIVFRFFIRGFWPLLHSTIETDGLSGASSSEISQESEVHLEPAGLNKYSRKTNIHRWHWSRHKSVTWLKIFANYSLLYEITCQPKGPSGIHNRSSLATCFTLYNRRISATDKHLEHISKFWHHQNTFVIPEALRSRQIAAFSFCVDSNGRHLAVPNNVLGSSMPLSLDDSFLNFWRLFIELDLLECYRFMNVHSLYGILEYDSQLPSSIHLPAEGSVYTVSLTCRQSLDCLNSLLTSWCTFVLMENSTFVRLLDCELPTFTRENSVCFDSDSRNTSVTTVISAADSVSFKHSFCVVRLEVLPPEFRLRLGFVMGTASKLQDEIVRSLERCISALRFPPRGRQAIPKSRHKSGAPSTSNDPVYIPPLQRSWEDIPCCHIFHSRLDRLVLNSGIWTKRLSLGFGSTVHRSTYNHIGNPALVNLQAREQGAPLLRIKSTFPVNILPHPNLELPLLRQHLYHESRVWVVQPVPLAAEGLRTIFAGLLNLRLQEGFHLVRVGPQPGFVNLAMEVAIGCAESSRYPCLVQYLLYPFSDAWLSHLDPSDFDSPLSFVDTSIRTAITTVISEQRQFCTNQATDDNTSISIFNIEPEKTDVTAYPFRSVQIITEVWIQPVDGHLQPPAPGVEHWIDAKFNQIPGCIFQTDERSVSSYVTLERLCTVLRSPVKCPVRFKDRVLSSFVHLSNVLSCLNPDCEVKWVSTDLLNIVSLSPQLTVFYSLLGQATTHGGNYPLNQQEVYLDNRLNDQLISTLCSAMLRDNVVVEIRLSSDDISGYNRYLWRRCDLGVLEDAQSVLPRWRCFIGFGGFACKRSRLCVGHTDVSENALITVIFIPSTAADAQHSFLDAVSQRQCAVASEPVPKPHTYLPIFLYSCSRSYLSYLVDDRWTYRVPPDSVFCFLQPLRDTGANRTSPLHCASTSRQAPDSFLNVGCKNPRLTSELATLWGALRCALDFTSLAHIDAFVITVHRAILTQHSVLPEDLECVLSTASNMFPIPKLVLDITSFCLCCCRHLLRIIQIAHFKGNHHGLDYASVLNGDRPNFVYPVREKLFIGLSHLGDNVNCTEEICARFLSLSDKFIRLETIHSGSVFVLRSGLSKVGSRPSSPVLFSPSMASRRNQTIPDYLATTVNHTRNAELYFSIESDTSESSVVLDAPREETFGHLTKHPQVQLDVDPVIRTIASWVDETAHETEKPFFIHLRLIMIYDNESIPIPLTEALPFSCVTRFEQGLREIVSRVHGSLTSTSRQTGPATQFELDLSLLRFHLEILPVFWSSERVFQFNVDECATSLSHTSQMWPQFTCTTFLLDELVNTINSWRHHSDSSSLSLAHKGVLSQLVLKLAWEMQDEVVCCLRLLVPATEGSLQLVLRHIEDTQKLKRVFLLTKRMSGLLGLHFDKNILLSSSTTSGERYCVRNSYRSYSFSMHTRGGIILKRIGLNFVVPAPQAFSKFLHHFEHFSFAPVNARLHYLGGYYFLVSAVKFDEAGLYGTPSSVGVDRRSSLQPPANNSPIGKLETSQQSSTTDISSVSLPLHQDILSCSDPSVKSAASIDPHTSIASHQELHKNLSTHGAAGPTPRKTIQPLSDDDSGDADEVVRFCRRLRAQSFPSARFLSQHLKESYLFDHSLDNNASNAGYEIPPYWLLLRLCTNSVSVFLHHTGTHISQSNYLRDISHFKQSRTLLIRCQTCHTYQFTVKSIHLLMRFVNQKLLLERLRDERICDPLLVPPPYDTQTNEDGVLFTKSPSDRVMHCSGSSTNRINGLPATQPSGRRPSCSKLHTRTSSTSDDTEFERVWCSNPFNSTPLNRRRHLTSAQRTMSRKNSSVMLDVPSWWRPGCFACPVQLTDRIRLHPRLFLATGSTQLGTPIGKGRRIVSALRKLLDKPSVFNQPDMFFLIDFTLRAPDSSETLDQTANNRRLNSMESSPGAPVFYMILKEVTVEAPGKDVCSFSLDGYVSDDFQFTGAQRTPEELRHVADKIGSEPPSCTDRGKAAQFLQFSLHGIEKPSRNLCKFVREMLQSRLDGLVLEHFSDGLSRNAINRLSSADLSFLVSRKSQSPTCHYYIAMPKFLSECNLPTHHPYAPRKLILAFCHYLKQNLSLFLHAVKLDRDAPLFGGYEHLELFLYHRPRAHGVEKLGVATIIFHLLTRSSVGNGSAPTSNLVPHTIKDWSLPNELIPLIAPVNFGQCVPSFDDLQAAVTDFHEISFVEVNSTVAVDQLLISIQIWERGEVDIENLKARIRSTVLHSIYDVITEFFVLTASMKSLVATNDDTNTSEPDNEVQSTLNPYISAVVLPWLRQGRHFDSSLVVKLNLRLASTLFVNQFLVDLLRPFHVTEVSLPSRASRTLDGSLDSMSFFVYHKGSENSSEYRLTGLDRLRGSSVSRPGQFSKFMIIGQNFPTWRRLLGRKIGTAGENSVLGRRRHPSKGVHSDPTHPELGFSSSIATGALLRMQPLLMVFNVPVPRSTPSVIEIDAKQKSCLSNRPIIDFSPSTTTIASPSRAAAAAVSLVTGDSISSDGLPGFCPINFQLPSDVTSIEGEHSEPSGFTLSYPQSIGSPICVTDVSVANAPPIAAAVSSAEQFLTVNVQVPRQAYCLFTIEDRQVTVYTYNWSREEVERLAHRCTALADWYNNRVKLLSTLSAQKLGLFHNLDDAFTRGCVSRTATLVYNTCPPELMGPVESPPSTSSLLEKPVWPVSISGSAVPIGTNFVKTQSTRRRYPTSGTDLPTSVSGPGGNVSNTPNASGHVGCTMNIPSSHGGVLSTESQIASVHNFLRLFRDCGCIPPLEPSTTGDLLHRHGRQALAALELDYYRAHQLELMSLPFRAWQAARRRSQPSEPGGVFTGSVTSGSQYSAKNHNPSSGLGSISAEAALASDPLPKRLRRFSSIRMACRLLHTVCTPILFYPAVRAKAVQAARLESITLRRVAEACYAAQQGGLRGGSRPDSDCEASQQQQQQHAYDDDRTLRAGALRAVIRTVQTEAPILPCDHSSATGNSITGARTLADTLSHTKVQTDLPISGHTQSPLSPWLSWSRNVLLDAAEEPTNSCKEDPNRNIAGEIVPSSKPPGTFGHTHDQYHRAALAFLAEYVRYLQHAVGFHVIPFTDPGAGVSARDQSASSTPTGSYALLHKTIHLAGVHIVEVFIRHFHLHIRLGTLELGRFSRHGSRCLIAGPLSAAVITQAAASAAATAASVRRDAATSMSRVPGLAITNPNIEPLYSGSSRIDHHQQHAISFSWDESSRLCDYTHIHSFSYDYYLRSIQEYLASQRHRRKPGNSASGRKFSNSAFTNAIGITDFPVTDFLSDLHLLSPQPPVFARGCLRSVQLSCPVGAHLRPDQVFHHLIEAHRKYDIQLIRMAKDRNSSTSSASAFPPKLNPSYTYGILELHLTEQGRTTTLDSNRSVRYSSLCDPDSLHSTLLGSSSSHTSTTSAVSGVPNAQLTDPGSNKWGVVASIAAVVVVNERSILNLSAEGIRNNSTDRLLHLIMYLIATDPYNRFPKSSLARMHEPLVSRITNVIQWPAVAPCLDLTTEPLSKLGPKLGRSLSNQGPSTFSTPNRPHSSSSSRSRYTSLTTDLGLEELTAKEQREQNDVASDGAPPLPKDTAEEEVRLHVSYLGTWPAHQVPVQHALESARAIIQERVLHVIKRSELECHKNLLWYRLFDSQQYVNAEYTATFAQPSPRPFSTQVTTPSLSASTVEYGAQPLLEGDNLSITELEELVHSAPFQLNVLDLDLRLCQILQFGASHFAELAQSINLAFIANRLAAASTGKMTSDSVPFACFFQGTPSNDPNPVLCEVDHHIAFFCPNFTTGFVLLSWIQNTEVIEDSSPRAKEDNFKSFQLRVIFRTLGDPTQTDLPHRITDSKQQTESLFFEHSPLPLVITTIVDKLTFFIWRDMYSRKP